MTEATPEKNTTPLTSKIFKYFFEHPAFAVSSVYIFVSAIGFFSASSLYSQFEINVFDYAETNDFLMAAFKDPGAFILTIVFFFSVWLYCNYSFGKKECPMNVRLLVLLSVL